MRRQNRKRPSARALARDQDAAGLGDQGIALRQSDVASSKVEVE